MKKSLFIAFYIFCNTCYAQNYFEGQVTFEKTYESLDSRFSKETLEKYYGKWMIGIIQENRYMVYLPLNESDTMKVYYFLETSDGYLETTDSDTINHFKIDEESGELITANLNKDQKIILGDTCQSFEINYLPKEDYIDRVNAKYYFNKKYKLNPKYYLNHKESFWNIFVAKTESISVRNEITNYPLYKSIYQASEIIEKKVDDKYFILNPTKHIKRMAIDNNR